MDDDEDERKLANLYEQTFTPTKEDLERVMTREEQIELCSKLKCRVDISRWNPVYEYKLAYTESGRYQRWNPKLRLRMLAHSVNLKKPGVMYDEKEIAEIRRSEWEMRKKDCILSLNYWKRQREKKVEALQQQIMNEYFEDSDNAPELEEVSICTSDPVTNSIAAGSENIENNLQNVFHFVNTESMTIAGSESQATEEHLLPSQDVIAPDYEHFNNDIPLTSTQSQNTESEDIEFLFN